MVFYMLERFDLIKFRDDLILIRNRVHIHVKHMYVLYLCACASYCSNSKMTIWRGNMNVRIYNVRKA